MNSLQNGYNKHYNEILNYVTLNFLEWNDNKTKEILDVFGQFPKKVKLSLMKICYVIF